MHQEQMLQTHMQHVDGEFSQHRLMHEKCYIINKLSYCLKISFDLKPIISDVQNNRLKFLPNYKYLREIPFQNMHFEGLKILTTK